MRPTAETHARAHPSASPNPPAARGSVPLSRACHGVAQRSRAEPRGRDGQRPGRGALPETSHGRPAYRLSPNPPVAPHEPPRGLRLFLRDLALGLLDLFYPPRHP